jgi:hypothetical protein
MLRIAAIVLAAVSTPLFAQWLNYPDSRTPRTREGKPNLSAPAPRMNGKPDLSGVWQADRTPLSEFNRVLGADATEVQVDLGDVTKHVVNVFWDVKPEDVPLRPEGAAIMQRRAKTPTSYPPTNCLPTGLPGSLFVIAFKMIQTPREIVVLPGTGDPPRQIYTDGRNLPNDPQPSWMGYTVGRWEGDTLAADTIGFTEKSWLDLIGHPRSESMRITERYRRRDFGHMDLEMTFDDPKYYTRPFTLKVGLHLIPDSDVLEFVCNENEKDRPHLGTTNGAEQR